MDTNSMNEYQNQERRINCAEKEEMLQNIRCLEFAITELGLYLDTHPDDKKALCLHRKYCNELKEMKAALRAYQRKSDNEKKNRDFYMKMLEIIT